MQTILLLKSAFLCVFRFFGLSSFDTVATLILSRLASFLPFFEVIPEIFGSFLSVIPRETEADLTRKAQSCARRWASMNKFQGVNEPSSYKNKARSYLTFVDTFNSEQYIEAVIQDSDNEKQRYLRESLRKFMIEDGLYGQTFIPKKDILTKKECKNIRQTAEGVKIEWEGSLEENNISISDTKDRQGLYKIIIKTSDIKDIQ